MMLQAFIQMDRKYLRIQGLSYEKFYERCMALPDVRGVADPAKKLSEDILGLTSGKWTILSDEESAGLKKNRDDFLDENETDFTFRWSGAPTQVEK